MKTLIKILCLSMLWFSCESSTEPQYVHGCLDSQACNYNPNANIDNNSCLYEIDCNDECGGDALLDNCDVCDNDTSNNCELDECGVWGGDGIDTDNDGICDDVDDCPLDPDNDLDDDGICDDIDDCIPTHADSDGMKILTIYEDEEIEMYIECLGVISNELLVVPAGTTWNFTVHFLDDECEEICELTNESYLEIAGYDPSIMSITIDGHDDYDEEHGYTFELETLAVGTTSFTVTLLNQGHYDYTSQEIIVFTF